MIQKHKSTKNECEHSIVHNYIFADSSYRNQWTNERQKDQNFRFNWCTKKKNWLQLEKRGAWNLQIVSKLANRLVFRQRFKLFNLLANLFDFVEKNRKYFDKQKFAIFRNFLWCKSLVFGTNLQFTTIIYVCKHDRKVMLHSNTMKKKIIIQK